MKNQNFIMTQIVKRNVYYNLICKGRRIFKVDSSVIPTKQTGQKEVFEWNDDPENYKAHIINLCRKEVGIMEDC